MAEQAGCSRRTAERMRDAVEAAFAPLNVSDDGRKRRFRLVLRERVAALYAHHCK